MCSNRCQNCDGTATHCDICAGDNRNPDCSCPDGYFDDEINQNCIRCSSPCGNCDQNGCLSCQGNRVLNGYSCDCPPGGIEMEGNSFCNSCQDVILDTQLREDYLLMSQRFSQKVNFISIDLYQKTSEELCAFIFSSATLAKLGVKIHINI